MKRQLTIAVLLCAAGAALALIAAGRDWAVEVTVRPAPLPALRTERTGGDLLPWLSALGWVALAGAGALLATRATARQLVGGLLALAGAGIAAGGLVAATGRLAATGAETTAGWPVLGVAGGLLVAAGGGMAFARGRGWPAMGARYERVTRTGQAAEPQPSQLWDALDRGEDPTAR